jgi:flagellar motor switch protein FliN/FliY
MAKSEKTPEEIAAEEAMMATVEQEEAVEEKVVASSPEPANKNLDLLMDVNLQITVELGRKDMNFGDILQLGRGSVVELNKMADEPVDIYVNRSKIAEGEVVVVDEHFGVRVTKLLSSSRIKKTG